MGDVLRILVVAQEHANLDSLPLRFGVHYPEDTYVELSDLRDLGVDNRHNDRHHYEGCLRDPADPDAEEYFGHFVVGRRSKGNNLALVTAWRNSDQESEYFLSTTLRNLREDGILNPQMLLRMHHLYTKGEINSSASLINYLSKTMAADEVTKAKAAEDRSRIETENAIKEMRAAKHAADHARAVAIEAIEAVETLEARVAKAENAEQEVRRLLVEAMATIEKSESGQNGSLEESKYHHTPARTVTAVWQSKTGSDYRNVGLEATVIEVERYGNNINLTYIGKDGINKTVQDFGYHGFVSAVFVYLASRKGKRSIFLVTQKPGKSVMLASDTMMLPAYKELWT